MDNSRRQLSKPRAKKESSSTRPYTNFWPGAMAWTGWWHNQVGLLTEVASARIATPIYQEKADPFRATRQEPAGAADFETERRRQMEHPDAPLPAPRDINARTEYP